ncbi:hypothetical protein [Sanguibacter sp. Leaf3]|uniref:hypothetical protein n=1 Tax=Sanguibacter sp. Leaf3 TaxID=1736209 RepID=UPI0006F92E94|nr:hypothetical protein [Sanguibacter sp. Leaf3]KQT98386.1 hypothetical protein ASG53_12050 [Sanguibacter sp. Leaf3]
MSITRTAGRLLIWPLLRRALRLGVWATVLLAPIAILGYVLWSSTSSTPTWPERVAPVAAVVLVLAALWSEARVRSDLARSSGVAPVLGGIGRDAASMVGVTPSAGMALRANWDLGDRLSSGLTVAAAIILAGYAPHTDYNTRTVWAAVVGAAILAGVTAVRRSGARRGHRVSPRTVPGLLIYGAPLALLAAAVAGGAWYAFSEWRGTRSATQLAAVILIAACIGCAEASVPAQRRRRVALAPALAASLRLGSEQLLIGEDPIRWAITYRRQPLWSKPQPVAITLHRPPAQVLTNASEISARLIEYMPDFELAEASPERVQLVKASAATLAARQVVHDSEGLYASPPVALPQPRPDRVVVISEKELQ